MKAGHSILVVEDEPKIREGLRDFLEFQEFAVTTVDDGLEAERIVDARRFDLILLDLMLPNISGEQLCRKWRQQGRTTPIIMLTAKGQESECIAGLDMGADDYVTKPFSLEELFSRIRAVLRRTDVHVWPFRSGCPIIEADLRLIPKHDQPTAGRYATVIRRQPQPCDQPRAVV